MPSGTRDCPTSHPVAGSYGGSHIDCHVAWYGNFYSADFPGVPGRKLFLLPSLHLDSYICFACSPAPMMCLLSRMAQPTFRPTNNIIQTPAPIADSPAPQPFPVVDTPSPVINITPSPTDTIVSFANDVLQWNRFATKMCVFIYF